MGPHPLLNRVLLVLIAPIREISNFAGMSVTKELIKGILRGHLKFIGLMHLVNYAVI